MTKIHLFIDNSNIFISAKSVAEKREGFMARAEVRLYFDNLLKLALAGRNVGDVAVVGSIPPEQRAMWEKLEEATGVKPELYERGESSGGEQGLDQCLQVHMLRAISDHQEEPQVAVLMTGDGAGYDDGVGFHADMERMYGAGWGIEVISWNDSCKRTLREWASAKGVFIALDDYYDAVTFLEGGRVVGDLNLRHRPMATPRASPIREAEERTKRQYEAEIEKMKRELLDQNEQRAAKSAKKAKHDRRYERGAKKKRKRRKRRA